jgi:REP element-mobilizing transposase RayT
MKLILFLKWIVINGMERKICNCGWWILGSLNNIFMRRTIFANSEYYHIYNRGVEKKSIFLESRDYVRFIKTIRNLKDQGSAFLKKAEPLGVEFIVYCLNPNHYHFILKQTTNNSISDFMHKLGTSYTMYFNKKYNRTGILFQGRFKSIHIDTDEYLLWLSAYINLNPKLHKITNNLNNYPWSSYLDYAGKRNGTLCNKEIVLNQFKLRNETIRHSMSSKRYKDFLNTCLPEMKKRKDLRKYFIEK